jgi:hypothetical protein
MNVKKSMDIGMFLLRQNPPRESGDMLQKMMSDAFADMESKSEQAESFRKGKEKGAIGKSQAHINELVAKNPNLEWIALKRMADKTIIANIKDRNFQNKISIARTALGLNKK